MYFVLMTTVSEVIESIGRGTLAGALGVSRQTISNAARAEMFPSAWYPTVRRLAAEKGANVPAQLFSWRRPEDAPSE